MDDLRAHEGALEVGLARIGARAPFAELLAERATGGTVRVDTKSTTPSLEPRLQGAIFRIWDGARWTEAAASAFDAASLATAIAALEHAASKGTKGSPPPGRSSTTRKEWDQSPARPVAEMSVEEKLSLVRDARGWATSVPTVSEAQVGISWEDDERLYLNSAGARCFGRTSRVRALVLAMAIENGRAEFDFDARGALGGREILDFLEEGNVRSIAENARAQLKAAAPPTGEMTVLLDPGVSGLFAHESFGHGTEADQFVRDRSYLKPILGQVVGPEELTLVDDGSYPAGWGTIPCDDEGHPAQRTVLVDRGRFVGALHDRETAAALRASPTGNTRRADFLSRAFVRMTNTFVEPGSWSFEELVKEAKNGVVLERGSSGIEDPLGGQMQLKVKRGHLIEHGKVTRLVGSMALSGKVLDFLHGIRGVGKTGLGEMESGFCGKGHTDLLPVGSGGVHLLSRAVVGPA